jgi:hypothetical protein
MAMARLMSEGCEERASFSVEGRGLSLNFCCYMSVSRQKAHGVQGTLSRVLPYLPRPTYIGFRSF